MRWRAGVTARTRKDAIQTARVVLEGYALNAVTYKDLTLRRWGKMRVDNAGAHRVEAVHRAKKIQKDLTQLAQIAYPTGDRPRGKNDISSIIYHSTTRRALSPIAVGRYRYGGRIRYVLLDGVHRLVSAAISGERFRVAIFDMRTRNRA